MISATNQNIRAFSEGGSGNGDRQSPRAYHLPVFTEGFFLWSNTRMMSRREHDLLLADEFMRYTIEVARKYAGFLSANSHAFVTSIVNTWESYPDDQKRLSGRQIRAIWSNISNIHPDYFHASDRYLIALCNALLIAARTDVREAKEIRGKHEIN